MKCCAGWLTNCNQDFWEKYQQAQICKWYHSYDRKWTGNKEPLDDGEREEWKSWLKIQHSKNKEHGIWPHHFMANKWGNVETVTDFIFLGFQIVKMVTSAMKLKDACSLEEKLWQIYKNSQIVKALAFPVVMYGCESRTIKKAEHRRTDPFKLWC